MHDTTIAKAGVITLTTKIIVHGVVDVEQIALDVAIERHFLATVHFHLTIFINLHLHLALIVVHEVDGVAFNQFHSLAAQIKAQSLGIQAAAACQRHGEQTDDMFYPLHFINTLNDTLPAFTMTVPDIWRKEAEARPSLSAFTCTAVLPSSV